MLEQGDWLKALEAAVEDSRSAHLHSAQRRTQAASEDDEAAKVRRYESCVYKVSNGDARTANRILKSAGLHPASTHTADLMASKFITDPARDSMARSRGLLVKARRCKAPSVQQKLVSKVVANCPDCKASGTSGWRSSRLKSIAAEEAGLRALTRWTQSWVGGLVPEIMACEWRSVLGVPLRKGETGDDVRPILVGEALMALPGACLQEITQKKALKLLASSQFGIGVPAGAESMVLQSSILAAMCRDDAFCALDMRNAFGEISRAEVMEEVLAELPELAPFVALLWGVDGTPIHIASRSAEWANILLLDGLFQGHNLSTLLFCLGMRRALKRFCDSYVEAGFAIANGAPIHMEYIDDMILKLPPDDADAWLPLLEHALGTVSLSVNLSKCRAWITSSPQGQLHPTLLQAGLVQVFGQLEVLGGAMDGAYTAVIAPSNQGGPEIPASSLKRVVGAENLSSHIQDMLATTLTRPTRRSAWTLLDKVLNKALDYDARILHPESFSTIAKRLDHVVRATAIKTADVDHLSETADGCLRLSAARGGCNITAAETKALFTHLAAACQTLPGAAQRLLDLGFERERIDAAINISGISCCLRRLREIGIFVRSDGAVITGVEPPELLQPKQVAWGQARKMYTSLLDATQSKLEKDVRVTIAGNAGSERELARLNSCSGPVSSRWLTEFPASWWPVLTDDRFVIALRFRLGVFLMPVGLKCIHAPSKAPEQYCEEVLDRYGDHATTCNCGPYISARHAAVNDILAQAGRDAGYAALLEQVVPELGLRKRKRDGRIIFEEARLDVELFGHPTAPDRLLDGTVRHPAARHIVRKAALSVGAAAKDGVETKEKRYPPRAGKSVIPCAVETWGHVDAKLDGLLADLAVLASQRQIDRGVQPTKWLSRWRTQISLQLAMSISKAILMAVPSHVRPCCLVPVVSGR